MNQNNADTNWLAAPAELSLDDQQVHVWRVSLNAPEDTLALLHSTLATNEAEQANRFRSSEHRSWFVARRGALRAILARYLDIGPAGMNFTFGPHGKPALICGDSQLQFNLSDSNGLAVIAITRGRAIGIDIEHIRSGRAEEAIAQRFFSTGECASLMSLPAGQRRDAFFNCWTRKEAYIKARGEGLSLPLNSFEVSLKPGDPATLLYSNEGPAETRRWTMRTICPGKGFAGCLAVEGNSWQMRCWNWSP